jgi:hypothetical protein
MGGGGPDLALGGDHKATRQNTASHVATSLTDDRAVGKLPSPEQMLVLVRRLKRRCQQSVGGIQNRSYQKKDAPLKR